METLEHDEIKDQASTSMRNEANSNLIQVPIGPITRAHTKIFKEELMG